MQIRPTEYTNFKKKCPLVTQDPEYSRDSRLKSFQTGLEKLSKAFLKEKELSVSSRF